MARKRTQISQALACLTNTVGSLYIKNNHLSLHFLQAKYRTKSVPALLVPACDCICTCDDSNGPGRGGPGRRCDCCPEAVRSAAVGEEHYQSPKDVDGDYSYAYR